MNGGKRRMGERVPVDGLPGWYISESRTWDYKVFILEEAQ